MAKKFSLLAINSNFYALRVWQSDTNELDSFLILNNLDVSLVTGVALLDKSKLNAFSSWERNDWLFAISNNKDVRKTGGETVAI